MPHQCPSHSTRPKHTCTQAAAASPDGLLLEVGAAVTVSDSFERVYGAKGGPLAPGVVGRVVADDGTDNMPWQVQVGELFVRGGRRARTGLLCLVWGVGAH